MIRNRAKRFLAVAMIMVMLLALQIPAFAAPLADFTISITPVADPSANPNMMTVTVTSTDWTGSGASPTGTLIIEYTRNNTDYTEVANVAIDADYTGYAIDHSIVLIGDTNIIWRARFDADSGEADDSVSNELYYAPGIHSTVAGNSAGGLSYDIGYISDYQTGSLDIKKTAGGVTSDINTVTLDSTYFAAGGKNEVIDIPTLPTEETTYSFTYTPDDAAIAIGYDVITGSAVYNPTYLPAPVAVDGYTVASITGSVPALDELVKLTDAAFGLSLQVTSSVDADVRITDSLDIIKNQMGVSNHAKVNLPGGVLVADLDFKYETAPDALDLTAITNFPDSYSMISITLTGLKAHDRVALLTLDMDRAVHVSYATVSAAGEATFNIPALEVENITGGVGTADYSAYLYANIPQPAVPVPVPVSPSTGVY